MLTCLVSGPRTLYELRIPIGLSQILDYCKFCLNRQHYSLKRCLRRLLQWISLEAAWS